MVKAGLSLDLTVLFALYLLRKTLANMAYLWTYTVMLYFGLSSQVNSSRRRYAGSIIYRKPPHTSPIGVCGCTHLGPVLGKEGVEIVRSSR